MTTMLTFIQIQLLGIGVFLGLIYFEIRGK